MTEILTEPVTSANVWKGDDLADPGSWLIRLAEEDFADFERALAHVAKKLSASMKLPKENSSSCPRRSVIHPESHNSAGPAPAVE